MKKKFFIISAAMLLLIAIASLIFLPTDCMKLSKAKDLRLENKFDEAFKIYQELAEDGNAEGMWCLSRAYTLGQGTEQSDSLAWKYTKLSANLGFDNAKADVACSYLYGWNNLASNEKKGLYLLENLYKSSKSDYVKARYAEFYIGKDKTKFDEIVSTLTETNDPVALHIVAYMYSWGEKTDGDKFIEYQTKAYENGSVSSASTLADVYLSGLYNKKTDKKKGIEWLKKGIDRLSTDCMNTYGEICLDDSKENKEYYNPSLGISMFEKAAKLNDGAAFGNLGLAYGLGQGVDIDNKKAVNYFEKATIHGDALGTYNYAIALFVGRGCVKNVSKAKELMQLAEDRECGEAAVWLTNNAINNKLGTQTIRKHLEKAVKLGNKDAIHYMAMCYEYGWNSYPVDVPTAFAYYKKAADAGNTEACKRVAECYRKGYGTNADNEKAKEYENMVSK